MVERRQEVVQKAKEFVDRVMNEHPIESSPLTDRSGQVVRASFADLPREICGRFSSAMSLVAGESAGAESALFRLGLAANAVQGDMAAGRDDIRLVTIPFDLLNGRQGRDKFLEKWRSYSSSIGQHLIVMLSELPPKVSHQRVTDIAGMLRSVTKRVGVMLDEIEPLPFNLPYVPFSMVGLASDCVPEMSEDNLRDFILEMHKAKARVLVRLSVDESPQRWQSLGAGFTVSL
jgi:hypothetical protein